MSFDAFLLWLFSWSKVEYKTSHSDLYNCAQDLLKILVPDVENIILVKVYKQFHHADVIAELEDDVVLIENKVGSSHSFEQIEGYLKNLNKLDKFQGKNFYPVLILLDNNDCNLKEEELQKVHIVRRKDVLKIIEKYQTNHHFLQDFYNHYDSQEKDFNSWRNIAQSSLSYAGLQGFFDALKQSDSFRGIDAHYSYVSNSAGGLMGIYYTVHNMNETDNVYFQLHRRCTENARIELYLKVDNSKKMQDALRQKILAKRDDFKMEDILVEYARSRYNASTQQVLKVENFMVLHEDGRINLIKTAKKLRRIFDHFKKQLEIIKND